MWWQQSWRIASKHSESLISSQTERNFSKLSPPTRVTYVMKAICKVPPIGCNWKHGGSSSACTVYARAMCAYAFLWRRSCEIQVGETDEWLPLSVERERERKKNWEGAREREVWMGGWWLRLMAQPGRKGRKPYKSPDWLLHLQTTCTLQRSLVTFCFKIVITIL